MNRRGFMAGILAAGAAPWVCTKAGVLMPVKPSLPDLSHQPWLRPGGIAYADELQDLIVYGMSVSIDGKRVDPKDWTPIENGGVVLNKPVNAASRIVVTHSYPWPDASFSMGVSPAKLPDPRARTRVFGGRG